jgi:hypothetical protein
VEQTCDECEKRTRQSRGGYRKPEDTAALREISRDGIFAADGGEPFAGQTRETHGVGAGANLRKLQEIGRPFRHAHFIRAANGVDFSRRPMAVKIEAPFQPQNHLAGHLGTNADREGFAFGFSLHSWSFSLVKIRGSQPYYS